MLLILIDTLLMSTFPLMVSHFNGLKMKHQNKNSLRTKQETALLAVDLILNTRPLLHHFWRTTIQQTILRSCSWENFRRASASRTAPSRPNISTELQFLVTASFSSSSSSSSTAACFPFLLSWDFIWLRFHFLPLSTPHEYLNERYWVSAASATNLLSTVGL